MGSPEFCPACGWGEPGGTRNACAGWCSVEMDRARSTLTLLSRFAVFMWMEAKSKALVSPFVSERVDGWGWMNLARQQAAAQAIEHGLLRLEWSR